MERLTLTLPALYGDHHVASVHSALDGLKGIGEIQTSPAMHEVSLLYDPAVESPEAIEAALAASGYQTGSAEPVFPDADSSSPRHTMPVAGATAFLHEPPTWEGRPLWPCPGFERTSMPDE
jgi:copper chaperone CopZ